MESFGRTVGLDRLAVLHLNDSKSELGSRRDRHQHIGKGRIGKQGFAYSDDGQLVGHIAGHRAPQPILLLLV